MIVITDPIIIEITEGYNCVVGLECLLDIVRALRMGSCLSAEGRSALPCSPGGVKKRKSSRRRFSGSQSSSFDSKMDEYLLKIPGRLFANGSSDVACLFTQQGRKGTNQDAMVVWENFFSRTDTVFCGVFDGHGPYGHLVAKKVRDTLPQKLYAQWEVHLKSEEPPQSNLNSSSMNTEHTSFMSVDEDSRVSVDVDESRVSLDVEESEKQSEIFRTLRESFLKAFKMMDRELRSHRGVDCFCSGTTAVTLIKKGQYLVVGNVGDSRAVLGTREEDDTLVAVQLTVDLKPNLPAEAERIKKCRGRVFALQDEPDVARVWLPNTNSPGLAMARAFGDFCLKDFGLIAVPDISFRHLSEKDQFIVLATDGVWDVLTNKEVVDIVDSAPSRATAARALVETAVRAWKVKYPTSKIDDCAVVCLFLDSDSNNLSCASNDPELERVPMEVQVEGDGPNALDRSATVRTVGSIMQEASDEDDAKEEMGEDWSALEGVTRVNTLLNLPRFTPGKK